MKSAGRAFVFDRAPVFEGFTLAFALQLRKKHGKPSVRVVRHKHTYFVVVINLQVCVHVYCIVRCI
jgi:hypothetical protein